VLSINNKDKESFKIPYGFSRTKNISKNLKIFTVVHKHIAQLGFQNFAAGYSHQTQRVGSMWNTAQFVSILVCEKRKMHYSTTAFCPVGWCGFGSKWRVKTDGYSLSTQGAELFFRTGRMQLFQTSDQSS
jgi:hypothetical protein